MTSPLLYNFTFYLLPVLRPIDLLLLHFHLLHVLPWTISDICLHPFKVQLPLLLFLFI